MRGLSRVDVAFLAVTVGVWVGLALLSSEPRIDRLFGAIMITCLLALLRLGVLAWLSARRARRHAADVARLRPDEAARLAVQEERARLGADIVRSLRESLAQVSAEVGGLAAAADPIPGLQRIQAQTRRATSDLRRQLGLLRSPDGSQAVHVQHADEPRRVPGRRDVVLAMVVALLAGVEVTAYLLSEGYGDGVGSGASIPVSVVLSVTAAASILLRRTDPVAGALWCAAAFGLGTLLGSPVGGGFWAVATVGALSWGVATSAPARVGTVLAWLALGGIIVHSRMEADRDNTFMFGLIVVVATVMGLAVRVNRVRGEVAGRRAREHEEALSMATTDAVHRERQQFAREIHDVVSHAIGLVAMQAAAAEVSWPHDPSAVQRAVEVIGSTAESTLAEIDRLVPGAGDPAEPPRVGELVDRIRSCGTTVHLVQEGQVEPALSPLTYRIVQEGLTNAVRHAPGARVSVHVSGGPGGLSVIVEDDGPGPYDRGQPGYGLVGVGERVALLGGEVTAGPRPGGRGFRLSAQVPPVDVEVTT